MLGLRVLKHEVQESVRFWTGDLPIYIFLIPTHPYASVFILIQLMREYCGYFLHFLKSDLKIQIGFLVLFNCPKRVPPKRESH